MGPDDFGEVSRDQIFQSLLSKCKEFRTLRLGKPLNGVVGSE